VHTVRPCWHALLRVVVTPGAQPLTIPFTSRSQVIPGGIGRPGGVAVRLSADTCRIGRVGAPANPGYLPGLGGSSQAGP